MSAVSSGCGNACRYAESVLWRTPRAWRTEGETESREIDAALSASRLREVTPEERHIVESVAGDLLEELGYEVSGSREPIPALTRARLRSVGVARFASRRIRQRPLLRNPVLGPHERVRTRLRAASAARP